MASRWPRAAPRCHSSTTARCTGSGSSSARTPASKPQDGVTSHAQALARRARVERFGQHLRLADDERAPLRPLRPPGLRQPLPAHARPPGPADLGLATAGEADGRGLGRAPRLDLPGLASPAAPGATRRARGRPSRAARPRWRAAAGSAGRPLLELQRAEGPEPAAALSPASFVRSAILTAVSRVADIVLPVRPCRPTWAGLYHGLAPPDGPRSLRFWPPYYRRPGRPHACRLLTVANGPLSVSPSSAPWRCAWPRGPSRGRPHMSDRSAR